MLTGQKKIPGHSNCSTLPLCGRGYWGQGDTRHTVGAHSRRLQSRATYRHLSEAGPLQLPRADRCLGAGGGGGAEHQGLGTTEAGVVGVRGPRQAGVKAGAPSGAGRGGRTREAGKGCDERRAVHCGNPGAAASGSSSLVPAEPGGGRERGTRGREARRRGRPGRSAERTGASGRPASGPSPCSRPVSAARASEPQAAGPPRLGPARPTAAARGALPGAREAPAVTLGPRAARSPPRPCPGQRAGPDGFVRKANPETNFARRRTPTPAGALCGQGADRVSPSAREGEPGMAWARGHRGPEAVTSRSARARSCCAQSLLARAPPARACPPGHNKVGREPQAVVRPAGEAPAARPEQARPGDHSRTESQAGAGWRGAMEAPRLSLAFCLLCAGEVLFLR